MLVVVARKVSDNFLLEAVMASQLSQISCCRGLVSCRDPNAVATQFLVITALLSLLDCCRCSVDVAVMP